MDRPEYQKWIEFDNARAICSDQLKKYLVKGMAIAESYLNLPISLSGLINISEVTKSTLRQNAKRVNFMFTDPVGDSTDGSLAWIDKQALDVVNINSIFAKRLEMAESNSSTAAAAHEIMIISNAIGLSIVHGFGLLAFQWSEREIPPEDQNSTQTPKRACLATSKFLDTPRLFMSDAGRYLQKRIFNNTVGLVCQMNHDKDTEWSSEQKITGLALITCLHLDCNICSRERRFIMFNDSFLQDMYDRTDAITENETGILNITNIHNKVKNDQMVYMMSRNPKSIAEEQPRQAEETIPKGMVVLTHWCGTHRMNPHKGTR